MHFRLPLLIFILLLACGIRLFHLDTQSIWFDEGWSAYAAEQPTLLDAWNADQTNPPLYYVLVNLAARGFGTSEFSLRYVSLLMGMLAVALSYRLGKEVTAERQRSRGAERNSGRTGDGISAALMVAFTPLMWWAAQEARMYTLLAVLVLIAALAWEYLRNGGSRWAWRALWLAELALLYAHNTGPIIVLWLNAVTLLLWLTRRSLRQPDWRVWIAGQIGVGLLYLPYFIGRFLLLPGANDAIRSTPPVSLDLLRQLWQSLWTGPWSMVDQEPIITGLSWIMLVLVLVSIAWRRAGARWLIVHTALLTGGLLLGLSVLGTDMHSRYLVMIVPLLLSAVSFGRPALSHQPPATSYQLPATSVITSSSSSSLVTRHSSPPISSPHHPITSSSSSSSLVTRHSFWAISYQLSAISLVLITCLIALNTATTNPRYQHDDARGMVQHYAETLGAGDTVLTWSYAERYELRYYWERLGVQAQLVTLPEGADMETILPLLPTSGAVARNVWFTQRADYRGMLGCLLGDGQVQEPEGFRVFGMENETYVQATVPQVDMQPFEARVGDIGQITSIGGLRPARVNQFECVSMEIELLQPLPADLQAQVYLAQNVDGQRVMLSWAYSTFADHRQRTSRMMQPGERLQAYALIKPPYGLPEGDYSVYLRIYDDGQQRSGYPLQQGDTPAVIDLPIGTWAGRGGVNWRATGRRESLHERQTGMYPVLESTGFNYGDTNTTGLIPVRNGDLQIVQLWWDALASAPQPLTLTGEGWSVTIPVPDYPRVDDVLLDIRRFQIPLEAGAGEAELRLPGGQVVGRYQIENIPAIDEEPAVENRLEAAFPNVGRLVGYTLPAVEADLSQLFAVNLVWQAAEASDISYTVFLQLIDTEGNVIAQSDMIPVNGTRPTTGWRSGEYILDEHLLQWNDRARTGSARLIVGLYDANTGERVRLLDGSDFIQLGADIPVR
jgi:4-amino-4-deoxy-L-arabinose transferase-like glycosyltransferase